MNKKILVAYCGSRRKVTIWTAGSTRCQETTTVIHRRFPLKINIYFSLSANVPRHSEWKREEKKKNCHWSYFVLIFLNVCNAKKKGNWARVKIFAKFLNGNLMKNVSRRCKRRKTYHKAINFGSCVWQLGFFLLHLFEARSQTVKIDRRKSLITRANLCN